MFLKNKGRKNGFPAACNIWDQNVNLDEMDQNLPHGGLIECGNSILDFFLPRSKVFSLHAILHHSAWAVKATTNNGPGFWYMLPTFPSSCLLGHINSLFFCIFTKFCLPLILQLLDWQSFFGKSFNRCTIYWMLNRKIFEELGTWWTDFYLDTVFTGLKTTNQYFKQKRTQKIYTA